MGLSLGFHGAARTVTGSRYLIESDGTRTVVDAGLFQGYKKLRKLNWRNLPFEASSVDQVLLTHAHIDHIGLLPRMVKNGFKGNVFTTHASIELAQLLLLDSAKIHEEDAAYANKKGFSKHKPALPLYTKEDAQQAISLLKPVEFNQWLQINNHCKARFQPAGHILGAASVEVHYKNADKRCRILFSGDIGRYDMPLHIDPFPRPDCDVLICESTYGNRDHDRTVSVEDQLCQAIHDTIKRKGTVLIPAFAVGRSQQLTLILRRLMKSGKLPQVPLHLDSPMAVNATGIYGRHLDEHHLDKDVFEDGRKQLFPDNVTLHKTRDESMALNKLRGPRIIISASGMLSGGRVIHHLGRLISKSKNTIVMCGYQAPGSRGRDLLEGKPTIRIHGKNFKTKAQVKSISGLSAHADRTELLSWLKSNPSSPKNVYLTHGEPEAAFAFADQIKRELGWKVEVPSLDYKVNLLD